MILTIHIFDKILIDKVVLKFCLKLFRSVEQSSLIGVLIFCLTNWAFKIVIISLISFEVVDVSFCANIFNFSRSLFVFSNFLLSDSR